MTRRRQSRRVWLLACSCLALLWFGAGWRNLPDGYYALRDSAWLKLQPERLEPGWNWLAPGLHRLTLLPQGEQRAPWTLGLDGTPLVSPEGARRAAFGNVTWAVEAEGCERLAGIAANDPFASLVLPSVRALVGPALRAGQELPGESAAMERRLADVLKARGIKLSRFTVDVVGAPDALQASLGRRIESSGAAGRVLLVGWDGADWNIMQPLLDEGRMPHVRALMERGSHSRLRTVAPVLSPVVWTSVATGSLPSRHGIVDFLAVDPQSGQRLPVTSNLRKVPALWSLLDRQGLPVDIVAWWATWPAEAVAGNVVTDRIAYQLFEMGEGEASSPEGKTWPPELFGAIAHLIVSPDQVTAETIGRYAPDAAGGGALGAGDAALLREFRTVLAATETYHAIAMHLAGDEPAVLQAVYYEATDTAAHLFMPYTEPLMAGIDAQRSALWGQVLNRVYEDLDRKLGELVAAAGEQTTVVLVSDHGFRSGDHRPAADARIGGGRAAEWHRKYGILVAAGPAIRRDAHLGDPSVIDVAPTVLASLGLPVPAWMDGRVLTEALQPSLLQDYPLLYQGAPIRPAPASTTAPVESSADRAIVERLRSLGYIGPEDVGRLRQNDPTAHNNRAAILLGEGDAQGALEELEKGLAQAPGATSLLINKARTLRLLKRDEEARALLHRILAQQPDLTPVENLLGNLYMDRGQLETAAAHFEHALTVDPHAVDVLVSRGLLAERQGRLEAALQDYRRASGIDPDSAEAFNNIGNVHRTLALQAAAAGLSDKAQASYGEAEAAYRDGMRADPDFVGSYNNLALIYQETGRMEQATALYERALDLAPQQAVVHNNLGSLYVAAGRLEEARQAFLSAIEHDPDYASAWNNLGAVYNLLGMPEEELKAYRKAVQLDKDYADGFHNLGLALSRRGQEQEAEAALERALTLNPGYISAMVALADIYLRQDQAAEAVAMMSRAVGINPRGAVLHRHLGESLLAAGRRREALLAFRQALALDPGDESAALRIRQLEGES